MELRWASADDEGLVADAGHLFDAIPNPELIRRQGIGAALVGALRERTHTLGCYSLYVLTSPDNAAAMRTYTSTGGLGSSPHVMFERDTR